MLILKYGKSPQVWSWAMFQKAGVTNSESNWTLTVQSTQWSSIPEFPVATDQKPGELKYQISIYDRWIEKRFYSASSVNFCTWLLCVLVGEALGLDSFQMKCSAVTRRECTWQQPCVAQTEGCFFFSFSLKNDCSVISDINLGDLQQQSCWDSNFQIRQHLKLQNSARAACWTSFQQQLLEAIILSVTHCGRNVGSLFFTTKLQFIEVCSCVEVWPLQHCDFLFLPFCWRFAAVFEF